MNLQGKRTDLGIGFSPVLTQRGRVALIRDRQFDYGESFDCHDSATKNWIAMVDPATGAETALFDHSLSFGRNGLEFCVFHQMQLSPDDSTLYLVSIVYATSGALAIIRLRDNAVNYIPGVDDVHVITSGPHRGELITSSGGRISSHHSEGRRVILPVGSRPRGWDHYQGDR